MAQPVILIIRDGWGINPHGRESAKADGNAPLLARTPYHDYLYATYPMSRLSAAAWMSDYRKDKWEILRLVISISEPGGSCIRISRISIRRSPRANFGGTRRFRRLLPGPSNRDCISSGWFRTAAFTVTRIILSPW